VYAATHRADLHRSPLTRLTVAGLSANTNSRQIQRQDRDNVIKRASASAGEIIGNIIQEEGETMATKKRDANSESEAAGQSGDLQGLPTAAEADSESVEELLEEGQTFEAEAVAGVEDAPDADQGEVKTKQVPENDVPLE
jgi:hypothetical protein